MSRLHLDPFFMLRRRWMPEHSARVFDGRRKRRRRVRIPLRCISMTVVVVVFWAVFLAAQTMIRSWTERHHPEAYRLLYPTVERFGGELTWNSN